MKTTVIFASMVLFLAGIAVSAPHHSAAAQDFSKRVELDGIVKKWVLANPHGVVILQITDAKGTRSIEYETHSRNNVYRAGYRDGMVKINDKIKVFIAPNRDGSDGGYIASFVTAKGDKVGN